MRALAVSEGWGGVNLVAKTLPRRVFTKRICLDAPPSSASFPGLLHLHPRFPKPPFRSGDGQRGFEPDILLLQVSGAKIKRLNILWYLRRWRDRVFLSKAFPSSRKSKHEVSSIPLHADSLPHRSYCVTCFCPTCKICAGQRGCHAETVH